MNSLSGFFLHHLYENSIYSGVFADLHINTLSSLDVSNQIINQDLSEGSNFFHKFHVEHFNKSLGKILRTSKLIIDLSLLPLLW